MLEILKQVTHRPWPLPRGPWIMRQVWHDLLFAHWPVAVETLRRFIPAELQVHTFGGQAWLGIVPFRMSGVRMRGTMAAPGLSSFPELNVRTYVVRDGKPGVWFFSLDAANRVAVWVARAAFHLPYFWADMRCQEAHGPIDYESRRKDPSGAEGHNVPQASFKAHYRPLGEAFAAQPGTVEHFLVERYCLYTTDKSGRLLRCEIHHPSWPLQLAEARLQENDMSAAAGITISGQPPLLHFSRRQDVAVWMPQRVK